MAHQVNPATSNTVVLGSASPVRVDPTPPSAKRYKVSIVNTRVSNDPADRVYVSFHYATCAAGAGHVVEADFGEREFYIDSNVELWAVRGGPNAITLVVDEYETV